MMSGSVHAQQESPDVMRRILDRLDALERQNQTLLNEVHTLREEIRASRAQVVSQSDAASQTATTSQKQPVEERLEVSEQRIKEQAQTKVESSQRFPVTLNGRPMVETVAQRCGNPFSV
jgi:hypothetical protein